MKTLWHKGANDITGEVFKIIKISTWSWWPLLIQILPVEKVVTAAFHIKNVARNHVHSSFLQRPPTVKLVWWHFLGLNNNGNTNNSVNSKILLSTKTDPFTSLTKQTNTYFPCEGNICFSKNPSMKPSLGSVTRSIQDIEFSNALSMESWESEILIFAGHYQQPE